MLTWWENACCKCHLKNSDMSWPWHKHAHLHVSSRVWTSVLPPSHALDLKMLLNYVDITFSLWENVQQTETKIKTRCIFHSSIWHFYQRIWWNCQYSIMIFLKRYEDFWIFESLKNPTHGTNLEKICHSVLLSEFSAQYSIKQRRYSVFIFSEN